MEATGFTSDVGVEVVREYEIRINILHMQKIIKKCWNVKYELT